MDVAKQNRLIVIVGPTGVGKTHLSIVLTKRFKTEIISADSRQFYREIEIGTAKPNAEELSAVPHHLINSLSIQDNYSVGDFEKQALQCLKNIRGILDEKKLDLDSVLKLTVFLTDLNNFDILNKVFETFFSKTIFPARAAVQVSRLPKDAQIEIDAICFEK